MKVGTDGILLGAWAPLDGVRRVLHKLAMVEDAPPPSSETVISRKSHWLRATRSGIAHLDVGLGSTVTKGETIATLHDPFGKRLGRVNARKSGVVIGHTQYPLVNRGDAVAHVAEVGTD